MDNAHAARIFDELADLTEIVEEAPFRARAYRAVAERLHGLHEPIDRLADDRRLESFAGGRAIERKLREIIATGACRELIEMRAEVPASLLELLRVPELDPASVRAIWRMAGVSSLSELLLACAEHRLVDLPAFDVDREERVRASAKFLLEHDPSVLLAMAWEIASRFVGVLDVAGARRVAVAGETRRGLEIVREIVLIAEGLGVRSAAQAIAAVAGEYGARTVEARNDGIVTVPLDRLGQLRVRCVDRGFVAAVIRETGDTAHVRWLDERALRRGTTLEVLARDAPDEEAIYRALDLPFVPPELREGGNSTVPSDLITHADLAGVFHVHTDWSDGAASVEDMARSCAELGLRYLGVSDHSRAASYANGLDTRRLRQQALAIEAARRNIRDVRIFHGIEVDILDDGSLDLGDDVLAQLDFVVASIHASLEMGEAQMTRRVLRALSNPLVTIFAHPTGRLLLARAGYRIDVHAVARAAAANGTFLEINANPHRLDLSPEHVRLARSYGARFAINPDAHTPQGIPMIRYGATVARRAGLSRADVLNAGDADTVEAQLAARKQKALDQLRRTR